MEKLTKKQKIADAENLRKQAKEVAEKGDYMSASFFAVKALKIFGEVNDSTAIKELKKLAVAYTRKSEETMQSREISVPLDKELVTFLESMVNELTSSDSLLGNLEKIVNTKEMLPSFSAVKKTSEEIVPITAQLVTHMSIGDEGHVTSFDDFETSWFIENYGMNMNLSISSINRVFSELIKKKQFTQENLMGLVISKGIFTGEFLLKLEAVLERRFANDYLSAIHILVPMFDKVFMHFSGLLGLDIYTYNGRQTSTRNKTLSVEILKSEEFIKVWGEDFCYMLSYFLYDPNAQRFRHKVAHGDITVSECNFTTFNIVFFFLLRVIIKVQVNSK